jgi:hypothetical protein
VVVVVGAVPVEVGTQPIRGENRVAISVTGKPSVLFEYSKVYFSVSVMSLKKYPKNSDKLLPVFF